MIALDLTVFEPPPILTTLSIYQHDSYENHKNSLHLHAPG